MSDASQDYDPVQSNLPLELLGESLPLSSTFGPRTRKPLATSIVMPCTVIKPGSDTDKALDEKQSPEWRGEKSLRLHSDFKHVFIPYSQTRRAVFTKHLDAINSASTVAELDAINSEIVFRSGCGDLWPEEFKWCQDLITARRPLLAPAASPAVTKKPSFLEGFLIWLKSLSFA